MVHVEKEITPMNTFQRIALYVVLVVVLLVMIFIWDADIERSQKIMAINLREY